MIRPNYFEATMKWIQFTIKLGLLFQMIWPNLTWQSVSKHYHVIYRIKVGVDKYEMSTLFD